MRSYFDTQFQRSPNLRSQPNYQDQPTTKVVVIGADCPLLNPTIAQAAFDALDQVPVVIGPSEDGGYYLIGMRNQTFDIFADVEWSTPDVLPQTIAHLERQKIGYRLLEPMNDIDDFEDLIRLSQQMNSKPASDMDSLDRELLRQIQSVIQLESDAHCSESD